MEEGTQSLKAPGHGQKILPNVLHVRYWKSDDLTVLLYRCNGGTDESV
jgi:hypothetical protein